MRLLGQHCLKEQLKVQRVHGKAKGFFFHFLLFFFKTSRSVQSAGLAGMPFSHMPYPSLELSGVFMPRPIHLAVQAEGKKNPSFRVVLKIV